MTKRDLLINAACVAVGAAIGSAVTWYVCDRHVEKVLDNALEKLEEELNTPTSLKDVPMGKHIEPFVDTEYPAPPVSYMPCEAEMIASVIEESVKITEECNNIMAGPIGSAPYVRYSDREEGGSEEMTIDKPYVISPEEFDDYEDYNKVVLTYYADQVLADDYGNIISDVENAVGHASLKTFGQYEEDTVFVRNDARRTDYEITRDLRNYSDVEDPYAGY